MLEQGGFDHLLIANPKLAPYGAAAVESLTRLGLLGSVEGKFVQGENIAQTYPFVSSGNAELGFVALSRCRRLSKAAHSSTVRPGSCRPACTARFARIAMVLTLGKDNPAARTGCVDLNL